MEGNLRLQSWSQTGSRRYWIVTSDEHKNMVEQYPLDKLSPRRLQKVVQLCQEKQQRIAEGDIVHQAVMAKTDMTTTSNWMRRTGWAETYSKADRGILRMLSKGPYQMDDLWNLTATGKQPCIAMLMRSVNWH